MYTARKTVSEAGTDSILFAHKAANMLNSDAAEEALQFCEEGVKRFPFYAEGHYVLARCYQFLNQTEDAREEFERTLYFSPGHLRALKALAYLNYQNNWREKGNNILLTMAAYDALNTDLMNFLRSENVFETPVTPTEPQEPLTDETLLDFETDEEADEAPVDDFLDREEEAESLDANISTEIPIAEPDLEIPLPDENTTPSESGSGIGDLLTEMPEPEAEPFTEPVFEIEPEAVLESDIPEEPDHTPEPEISAEEEPVFEEIAEDVTEEPAISSETELNNAVEELFTEDEPAVELEPIQESSGLDLEDITGLTDTPEEEREDFERNDIEVRLDEQSSFKKPLDLDQFDNTEDDFSTLIEGYFQNPDEEVIQADQDSAEPGEPEQAVEERSFLDTSVIFREKRSEDMEETPDETPSKDMIEDMNKVADEIELMSTKASFAVEKEIEESTELQHELEEKLTAPDGNEIDGLDAVIEKIEKAEVPEVKPTDTYSAKDAAALDDEDVNIEDLLKNPSLVTPTFGEILIAQKKFEDARKVFSVLSETEPGNKRFQKKIEFLDKIVKMQK